MLEERENLPNKISRKAVVHTTVTGVLRSISLSRRNIVVSAIRMGVDNLAQVVAPSKPGAQTRLEYFADHPGEFTRQLQTYRAEYQRNKGQWPTDVVTQEKRLKALLESPTYKSLKEEFNNPTLSEEQRDVVWNRMYYVHKSIMTDPNH